MLPARAVAGPAADASAHAVAGAAEVYTADINTAGAGVTAANTTISTALLSLITRKHQMLLLVLAAVVAPCKRFSATSIFVRRTEINFAPYTSHRVVLLALL